MDAELGAQCFQKLVSFLRLFPSIYDDGGSRRSLQVEIRSVIILLTAEVGQKAPRQGWEIFYLIMSADLWRYERQFLTASCSHMFKYKSHERKCT